ncbi:hypothetical protein CJ030_MR5G022562 [Morella rubra]|uniref:Uncharacterized protein n=1 Tax=Morella rubra TaxID=262757 RepID=A0A6A1VJ21_9ROSI|nr:hypothetical protein CJ030_MR5G022562 [Morella rubra]
MGKQDPTADQLTMTIHGVTVIVSADAIAELLQIPKAAVPPEGMLLLVLHRGAMPALLLHWRTMPLLLLCQRLMLLPVGHGSIREEYHSEGINRAIGLGRCYDSEAEREYPNDDGVYADVVHGYQFPVDHFGEKLCSDGDWFEGGGDCYAEGTDFCDKTHVILIPISQYCSNITADTHQTGGQYVGAVRAYA